MGSTTEQLISQATQYPDYVVLLGALCIFIVYGFVRKTKALSELALALPIAAFVMGFIPFAFAWGESVVFGVVTVLSAIAISRDSSGLDDNSDLYKVLLAAIGATGFLFVISTNVIDITPIYTFGNPLIGILTDATYRFYIIVGSLIAIALARKV